MSFVFSKSQLDMYNAVILNSVGSNICNVHFPRSVFGQNKPRKVERTHATNKGRFYYTFRSAEVQYGQQVLADLKLVGFVLLLIIFLSSEQCVKIQKT